MARTWDEKNNDLLKIERETAAYQAGKEAVVNEVMQIGGGTQARLTSKQKREAFDKFVIDWRKQNSLEGTDVMPPNEVVPLWMRKAEGKNEGMTIAGNPSFDINETPATRRTRKIRTLQERGVGGEKGNAGDILKKGIQLPNIQANVDYGTPTPLDKYWQKTGYPSRDESDEERLRKVRGSIPYA